MGQSSSVSKNNHPLNNESNFNYGGWSQKDYDPACLFTIKVAGFDVEKIQSLIDNLEIPPTDRQRIRCLMSHYQTHEEKMLIRKIDSLLIYKGHLPLMEIRNENASEYRRQKDRYNRPDRSYWLRFDINLLSDGQPKSKSLVDSYWGTLFPITPF